MNKKHIIMAALLLIMGGNAMAQKKDTVVVVEEEKDGYSEATARSVSPIATAHTTPIAVDLTVTSQRITHTETFGNSITAEDLSNPDQSAVIRYMKDYTLTRATKSAKADVILVPTFEINTSDDFKTITVEVTGYPASYTNFRKATNADLELIRNGFNTSANTPKPTDKQTTIINTVGE